MTASSDKQARGRLRFRARSTNLIHAVPGLDGRSIPARRYRDLIRGFTIALGGTLTDAQTVAVQRAAGLTVAAEEARAKTMRGEVVEIADLVKLENLADRAVRALNIKPGAQPRQTLADYVASKQQGAAA